jgi:hypothetical protein
MKIDLSRLFGASLVVTLSLFAAACGGGGSSTPPHNDGGTDAVDAPASEGGAILVTVSGSAAPHPLNAALAPSTADGGFTMINVAVVDPALVIANPNGPPLQGGPLDTSPSNCGDAGCAWSFNDVDISHITLGLVGILSDARTTSPLWVKTGTGAGTAADIAAVQRSPMPITNRPLFAVSTMMEAALATFAAAAIPDGNLHPGDLTVRGFMLGTITDKLSVGATPVAGASVSVAPAAAALIDIVYPNADFSGAGTTTASHGTFLVVPKLVDGGPPGPIVTQWTVTPPSGSTLTWIPYTSGTQPGTAFVLLFLATE